MGLSLNLEPGQTSQALPPWRAAQSSQQSQQPQRRSRDDIINRDDLGETNTPARQWRRGMIIQVPHIVPTLGNVTNPDHRVWTKNVGNVCPNMRYAIIVAVYETRMVALPIFTADDSRTSYKPGAYPTLAMEVLPASLKIRETDPLPDPTDMSLYVAGDWEPRQGAYVNLNETLVIEYAWPLRRIAQLDGASAGLLQQRYRVAFNTGFADLGTQEWAFVQQCAREPMPPIATDDLPANMIYGHFLCTKIQPDGAVWQYDDGICTYIDPDGEERQKTETAIFIEDLEASRGVVLREEIMSDAELWNGQRAINGIWEHWDKTGAMESYEPVLDLRRDSKRRLAWHVFPQRLLKEPFAGREVNVFRGMEDRTTEPNHRISQVSSRISPRAILSPHRTTITSSTFVFPDAFTDAFSEEDGYEAFDTTTAPDQVTRPGSAKSSSQSHNLTMISHESCKHTCKDKSACRHQCCKNGVKRKRKD